ncbi:MAG: hypothetical protein L0G54_13725, partial [Brevibacterium sp.]|nr:hypothetical protein [Brevibacterium sp.]
MEVEGVVARNREESLPEPQLVVGDDEVVRRQAPNGGNEFVGVDVRRPQRMHIQLGGVLREVEGLGLIEV